MVYRFYALMIILSLTLITVGCQSFQYSKGWTNGKRGDIITKFKVYQPSESKLHYPKIREIKNEQTTDSAMVQCDLQKMKILLQSNNNNKQFYLLPCEVPHNLPRVKLNKPSNQLLRRLSIYEDSNDNDDNEK
ncbi:hypothetical protein PV325_011702 [Microctonus aethiopoides]|nr:hypothetical protein PV325_011702 [Microctonus aethiopoides]